MVVSIGSIIRQFLQHFSTSTRLRDLPQATRNKIYRSLILINVFFIVLTIIFCIRIVYLVKQQDHYIKSQISISAVDHQKFNEFREQYTRPLHAKLFWLSRRLIDIKSEAMPIEFRVTITYPESWGIQDTPQLDLEFGGFITSKTTSYHRVINGEVEEMAFYEGNIPTNYSSLLYPLDTQLIILSLGTLVPNEANTNLPYLFIDEFENTQYLKSRRNYKFVKSGFFSWVNHYSLPIGNTVKDFYNLSNYAYLLYSHKNILSYLKVTQFIIFSILIAIFALLINPKRGSAISGRISVIGSAVFSLATNGFQVMSLINPGSGINLIDLFAVFAGAIILICFLVTATTVKLNDECGHNASRLYDLLVFRILLLYPLAFFIITYIIVP